MRLNTAAAGKQETSAGKVCRWPPKTVLKQVSIWTAPCRAQEAGGWERIFAEKTAARKPWTSPWSLLNPIETLCLVIRALGA